VKGRDVGGRAGLYVHVAAGANPQAANRVEGAAEGTFDWREVTIDFAAAPIADATGRSGATQSLSPSNGPNPTPGARLARDRQRPVLTGRPRNVTALGAAPPSRVP
jgi:hypothetical protein